MILDLSMHLKHDLKIWKTKVIELQGATDKSIIIVGDLHFFFSITEQRHTKKPSKDVECLDNTINKLDTNRHGTQIETFFCRRTHI